ncbi:MAG: cysteine hydrolase family protein [Thermomicrobiales bacterium]
MTTTTAATEVRLPVRHFRLFPAAAPHGETDQIEVFDARESALLLIDVYHAAETPVAQELVHSAWDREFWRIVDDRLVPLIAAARAAGLPVVYAMNSAPRIALDRSAYGRCFHDSLGFDPAIDFAEPDVDPLEFYRGAPVQLAIPPQIAPTPGDYYVRKHTYSGFFETRLDSVLRNLGARTLICAGFATDCCILFTIADAVFRGYRPILLRDCTLGAELPDEIGAFARTRRTVSSIEGFLAPSATSADAIEALSASRAGSLARPS